MADKRSPIPSVGSSMKEGVNLEVGEDSEKVQLGERLERGKRMKQQQTCRWCMVACDLHGQGKKIQWKVGRGRLSMNPMKEFKQTINIKKSLLIKAFKITYLNVLSGTTHIILPWTFPTYFNPLFSVLKCREHYFRQRRKRKQKVLREPIPLLSARHLRNNLTASLRPCLAARMNQSTALQLLSSSSSSSANLKKCFPTYNKQQTEFLWLTWNTL